MQSSEREKEMFRQQLRRKEAELTRAEQTIKREQKVRQHVYTLQCKRGSTLFQRCVPQLNCSMCTEVEAFLFPVQEVAELLKQQQSSEREKERLRQQLMTKKSRLLVHTRGLTISILTC